MCFKIIIIIIIDTTIVGGGARNVPELFGENDWLDTVQSTLTVNTTLSDDYAILRCTKGKVNHSPHMEVYNL